MDLNIINLMSPSLSTGNPRSQYKLELPVVSHRLCPSLSTGNSSSHYELGLPVVCHLFPRLSTDNPRSMYELSPLFPSRFC